MGTVPGGYCVDAAAAWLEHAFETLALPRVISATDPLNLRSLAVMHRLGFVDDHEADLVDDHGVRTPAARTAPGTGRGHGGGIGGERLGWPLVLDVSLWGSSVRRLLPIVSVAAALLLLCAGCGKSSPRPSAVPHGRAAVVDGVGISVDQVNATAKADQASASQQGTPAPSGAALNRQALGELVQSQIILDGAKREGITVSDADVEAQVQKLRAQVTDQHGNFDQALAQRGLTLDLLRQQVRPQLAAQKVAARLVPSKVSDAELAKRRADFPQVRVRHVLVRDKATADKVRAQLVAGGSWTALAKRYSQDPGSKDNGGDLGFTSKGETVPEFEKAVFALAGQGTCKGRTGGACASPVSQPVKSQFGYHVIQVTGVRLPPIDDQLREQVEPGLQQRRQNALQSWFKDQAAKTQVRVDPAYGKWNAADATVVDPSAPATTATP